MTRSSLALSAVLAAVIAAGPAWSQPVFTKAGSASFSTITAQSIGPAATVNGTALSTVVSQAGAALPASSLPSAPFRGTFDDAARALADRMSDRLNVKAFGAKGDGVTDDTAAFQNAAAVATGHIPTSLGAPLSTYLAGLGNFLGIGPKQNGAIEIDIPAGHYILSAPIAVANAPNSSIHWRGAGSSMTELQFNGAIDGLVTTFSNGGTLAHNSAERSGAWTGQGIMVTGIHFLSNTGIVAAATGGGTNINNGQGEAGAAVKTIALPVIGASTPPLQVYDDLTFTNTGGWNDGANNWKYALYLQDPDDLFVNRLMFDDRSLASNVTSVVVYVHSTAAATGPGHEFLNFDNMDVYGGAAALQMDGNDIQGVNVTHLTAAYMQQGIVWLPPSNSLSGSLTIADSSIGANYSMVHVANASTIFSHDNFYYNVSPPKNTNPIFFYVIGGDTIISHHDQFVGPLPGYEGTGYTSTAMFVSGYPSADVSPGHISDDTISHFDNGILFGGGSTINFTNDVVASDTTRCYADTSGATATNLHAQFDGIYCGGSVSGRDGLAVTGDYDWTAQHFMNGGLEIGMPGVTSPAGVSGYGGLIDFHSLASTSGIGGLNDYDVRLIASGGTAGTSGAGALTLYGTGGLTLANGPLTGASMKLSGAASMASGSVTGSLGIGQYLTLGSVTMANLATSCGAGSLVYVSDGRKTGEAAGAGSGVPAVCLPTSKGGGTGWYALQPSTLSN